MQVKEVLGWCDTEFSVGGKFIKQYYNLDNVEKQFSKWDGSHHVLSETIREYMHDAGSYEHLSTRYIRVLNGENAPYLQVETEYSGRNAFGGVVKQRVIARIDIDTGVILDIVEQ